MEAFKLSIATILARKTFVIWLVLLVVGTLLFPNLVPWEERPGLLQPARAQTAWSILWVIILGWGLYQAASFGDRWSSDGILEYLKAMKKGRYAHLVQLWASCMVFLLAFLAVGLGLTLLTTMPGDSQEARMWVMTNLQYAVLFILAMAPLLVVAIALGTRLNVTAAYCLTAGLALHGLFGVGYLDFFLSQSSSAFLDFLFVISPHYHLADLTDRLVFKMGALDGPSFLRIATYLTGLGLLNVTAGLVLYRERK